MVKPEIPIPGVDADMEQRIVPLVNRIFEQFNQEQIAPSEAGMVVMAMVYRIMEVLNEAPEARRFFVLTLINVVNNFLADDMGGRD
jgi:hypothetical protein